MTSIPSYTRNGENFAAFHALQNELVHALASHPPAIRAWLEAQPRRHPHEPKGSPPPPKAWRTSRLSTARRRELLERIRGAEESPEGREPLAALLLAGMPVRSYLEIAEAARASPGEIDPRAHELCRRVARQRELLLLSNYGLAQTAARRRNIHDPSDLLSAAACGLLDAIDRYVPGDKAARFGYFAAYWIRYHVSRQTQKYGSVVSYPINQHRNGRRIDRYLASRRMRGLPAPSGAEVCADLKLGEDAYHCYHLKPQVVSFQDYTSHDARAAGPEHFLRDPSPPPDRVMEEAEIGGLLALLLRTTASPAIRVMLAYGRSLGSLTDAAGDYLAQLHDLAMERIRPPSRPLNGSRAFGTACDPVFRAKKAVGNP